MEVLLGKVLEFPKEFSKRRVQQLEEEKKAQKQFEEDLFFINLVKYEAEKVEALLNKENNK